MLLWHILKITLDTAAKQTPNIKPDPTSRCSVAVPLTESKTQWLQDLQLANQVCSAWSEPHANSFDHSLNIIREATDSAVFANIMCGIQSRSLTPAPVEPQLHLLVKRRQSPLCNSTGKTQMKAVDSAWLSD